MYSRAHTHIHREGETQIETGQLVPSHTDTHSSAAAAAAATAATLSKRG